MHKIPKFRFILSWKGSLGAGIKRWEEPPLYADIFYHIISLFSSLIQAIPPPPEKFNRQYSVWERTQNLDEHTWELV